MDSYEKFDADVKFPPLIEQYERKIYDLRQLIEISKGLNSTLDYNILIDSILLTCMGQLQLMNAGIFLMKSIGGDKFSLHRNYKGFELDHIIDYSFNINSELIKFFETHYRSFTYNEIVGMLNVPELDVIKALKPDLVVPLQSKGEINGLIVLGDRINRGEFSEGELEYIMNIASLAGIAINNARLYEMATTDMMTRLKIHHYFQTILVEEMKRAHKYERPLSLIIADIDNFKKFNDTHGHLAGDEVLRSVASVFRDSVRLIDIASRYGGEEFAIILPKTDINEAIIVAERIRSAIESLSVSFNDRLLQVTISIGVTQYDSLIDKSRQEFIERADRALYMSKNDGKNRVSFL